MLPRVKIRSSAEVDRRAGQRRVREDAMSDVVKILELIANCNNPERLRSWIRNAPGQGRAASRRRRFRKLVRFCRKKAGHCEESFLTDDTRIRIRSVRVKDNSEIAQGRKSERATNPSKLRQVHRWPCCWSEICRS